jgi:hypothetical protein
MAQLTVAMNKGGGSGLQIPSYSFIQFAEQSLLVGYFNPIQMPLDWQWRPMEKITPSRSPVESHLVSAQDQAREAIPAVAHTRQVSPGVC